MKKFMSIIAIAIVMVMVFGITACADYSYVDEVKTNIEHELTEEGAGFERLFVTEFTELDNRTVMVHITVDENSKEEYIKYNTLLMKHEGYTDTEIKEKFENEEYNYVNGIGLDLTMIIHENRALVYGTTIEEGIESTRCETYDDYLDLF